MNHFINLKDVPAKDLQKIVDDAKKRNWSSFTNNKKSLFRDKLNEAFYKYKRYSS